MLETEYKSLISKEAYRKIENFYDWDWVQEQTNNYYSDKDGVLADNRIMFRVRSKGGKSVIQVKHHKNKNSSLQICEENEFPIDGVPEIIENGEKYTGLVSPPLYRLGCTVTLRHSRMWDSATEICLDKTSYFDRTDYEIEVEYTGDEMPEKLLSELAGLGVEFKAQAIGKYSRFLQAYKEQDR